VIKCEDFKKEQQYLEFTKGSSLHVGIELQLDLKEDEDKRGAHNNALKIYSD
jgi:hypothetical protein